MVSCTYDYGHISQVAHCLKSVCISFRLNYRRLKKERATKFGRFVRRSAAGEGFNQILSPISAVDRPVCLSDGRSDSAFSFYVCINISLNPSNCRKRPRFVLSMYKWIHGFIS